MNATPTGGKRQEQRFGERRRVEVRPIWEAGDHAAFGVTGVECSTEPVPGRKYGAEIRVELAPVRRVMGAVERGCDEDASDHRLEAPGKIEVPVFEQVRDEYSLRRNAERDDCCEADGEGEEQLPRMEAQSRRDVEARVCVVDLMEAPEQRQPMVGAVPEVGDRVEPEHSCSDGNPRAGSHPREQSQSLIRGPGGDDPAAGSTDHGHHDAVDGPEAEIRTPGASQP